MTKWPIQKTHNHITAQTQTEHEDATDIQKKTLFYVFVGLFIVIIS